MSDFVNESVESHFVSGVCIETCCCVSLITLSCLTDIVSHFEVATWFHFWELGKPNIPLEYLGFYLCAVQPTFPKVVHNWKTFCHFYKQLHLLCSDVLYMVPLLNSKEGACHSQKYSDHLIALKYFFGPFFYLRCHFVEYNFLECYNCPSFFVYSLDLI